METGSSVEEVREDARGILEEMSQNLQLGFIRLMAYVLSKVFKRLFSSVLVNMEGLNAVRTRLLLSAVDVMVSSVHFSVQLLVVVSHFKHTYSRC